MPSKGQSTIFYLLSALVQWLPQPPSAAPADLLLHDRPAAAALRRQADHGAGPFGLAGWFVVPPERAWHQAIEGVGPQHLFECCQLPL